jgi:phosphatidate cytidylyltransferase
MAGAGDRIVTAARCEADGGMLPRILTGVILIAVVVGLVWWAPAAVLAAAAAIVAIIALMELFDMGERVGLRAFRKWTIVCAAGLFYAQYAAGFIETRALTGGVSLVRNAAEGALSIEAVLLIFLFGAVGIGLATRRPLQEVLPAIAISSAGLLFVALPFSYLVRINEIERTGRQLVLFVLCLIWAGDTFAYFVGRSLGRLPMAPALSPKKTWEGAFANLFGSLLVAILFARWMQVDILSMLVTAGLANIAGQMGDLIESAYKRGAGVKDSSSLLPGHGGMLDRIDSLILASPVVWIVFQWLALR